MISGLLLIVLGNAVALSGVYYNRSGEADAHITLTQREMRLPYSYGFDSENSGIALRLDWRIDDPKYNYASSWGNPLWMDKAKLTALGFNTSFPLEGKLKCTAARDHYRKMLPRDALLVLEYDGDAYQVRLKRLQDELAGKKQRAAQHPETDKYQKELKQAERVLKSEKETHSRLFVVDAGLELETLRKQYPDRAKYIIAGGQVGIRYYQACTTKPTYLTGQVKSLNIDRINAPYRIRKELEPYLKKAKSRRKQDQPKYKVTVTYGRRLEPWIENISIDNNGSIDTHF